jgi:hypothetical protein
MQGHAHPMTSPLACLESISQTAAAAANKTNIVALVHQQISN